MNKSGNVWSMGEARANLEEVIRRAQTEGPQTVTRYGKAVVVVKDGRKSLELEGTQHAPETKNSGTKAGV